MGEPFAQAAASAGTGRKTVTNQQSIIFLQLKIKTMDKEKKNRTESSHDGESNSNQKGERRQTSQPGAPSKSNRQTKGHDEMHPERESGNKKGPNSV